MSEAIQLAIVTGASAVLASIITIAGKRWIESRPRPRDLYEQIRLLWDRCDELQTELDECKTSHTASLLRVNELTRTLDDMQCRGVAGCPLVHPA